MAGFERVESGVMIRRDQPHSLIKVDPQKVNVREYERSLRASGIQIKKSWMEGERAKVYRVTSVSLKYPELYRPPQPVEGVDTRMSTKEQPQRPPSQKEVLQKLREKPPETRMSTKETPTPSAQLVPGVGAPVPSRPGFGTIRTKPEDITPEQLGLVKPRPKMDVIQAEREIKGKPPPRPITFAESGMPQIRASETIEYYAEAGLRDVPKYIPALKEYPFNPKSWGYATTAISSFAGGSFYAVPYLGQAAAGYRLGEFGGMALGETIVTGAPTSTVKGFTALLSTPKGAIKTAFGFAGAVAPSAVYRTIVKPKTTTEYVFGKQEVFRKTRKIEAGKTKGETSLEYTYLERKPTADIGLKIYTPKEIIKAMKKQRKSAPELKSDVVDLLYTEKGDLVGFKYRATAESEKFLGFKTRQAGKPPPVPERIFFKDVGDVVRQQKDVYTGGKASVAVTARESARLFKTVKAPSDPYFIMKGTLRDVPLPFKPPTYKAVSPGAAARAKLFTEAGKGVKGGPGQMLKLDMRGTHTTGGTVPFEPIPIRSDLYIPQTEFISAGAAGIVGVPTPTTPQPTQYNVNKVMKEFKTQRLTYRPQRIKMGFDELFKQTQKQIQITAQTQAQKQRSKMKQRQFEESLFRQKQPTQQAAAQFLGLRQPQISIQKQPQVQKQPQIFRQKQPQRQPSFKFPFPANTPKPTLFPDFLKDTKKKRKRKRPKLIWDYGAYKHPVATPKEMLKNILRGGI